MHIFCKQLIKRYRQGDDSVTAVNIEHLEIPAGQITVIFGVSGSGKTSLLKLLGLLEVPTSGQIFFDSLDTTKQTEIQRSQIRARDIGFVHQNYNLLPLLSAEENILLPCYIAERPCDREALHTLTDLLKIRTLLHRFPSSLSGGQQQRVAIARALINRPKLILADEPTGSLDRQNTQEVIRLFRMAHQMYSPTIVIVTHDPELTVLADQVYTMENGHLTLSMAQYTGKETP